MHNLVLFKYGIERANGTEGADYDALMKKLVAERNDRTPSGEADEEELSRLLIETIFQLSTEERIALICFFHDRMMLNDIAVMMDCSRDQIKALIFSARGRIREQMGRYELERHVDIKSISPYLARGMQIYNEEHLLPVSNKGGNLSRGRGSAAPQGSAPPRCGQPAEYAGTITDDTICYTPNGIHRNDRCGGCLHCLFGWLFDVEVQREDNDA